MLRQRQILAQRWLPLVLSLSALGACKGDSAADSYSEESVAPRVGSRVQLGLTGYNYTNQYIKSFSVDGQGGGNVNVSSPNGGGGGTACCIGWNVGANLQTATVRWEVNSCHYDERKGSDGRLFSDIFYYFKEMEVPVDSSNARNPAFMEVHFYPDGRVEAVVTGESSPPRLKLSADREVERPRKLCPGGKRPVDGDS